MNKLFFGGIHPKYNKEMSTRVTTFHTITPKQVVIPLVQHIGAPCKSLVAVGDKVLLIPGHCCSTVNLHDRIYLVENDRVVDRLEITARKCGK